MKPLSDLNLNEMLKTLENPIRREIVKRLSQEPNYPFQLAKDLGLAQQQVAKHLVIMEDAGLVSSSRVSTSRGPNRRSYVLNKSLSIIIDVGPHLFKEKIVSFDVVPEKEEISTDSASFMDRIDEVLDYPSGKDRIEPLAEILNDIDKELERNEVERVVLLHIRNSVMRETSKIFENIDDSDARRVIHSAINAHERNIKELSKTLNLREDVISEIIDRIKKTIETEYL